ncbi:unnamed protein product [Orchesella dallaii]|uniref:DOMON domain-containing protein n=1 Tax=Orchesella dallaii TaxID=48710 RepID=A0ABP1PS87_9HEXA
MSFNKVVLAVVLCATVAAGAVRHLHLSDKYMVNVDIIENSTKIELELIVTTTGYVGFGIGPNATMTGADLFIGGVNGTETAPIIYGDDYHGIGNQMPVLDTINQAWNVTSGSQANGTTTLKITRSLDTGDNTEDIKIENNANMFVLWSIGASDNLEHHSEKGSKQLNLFTADDTNSSGVTAFSVSTLIMSLVAAFLRN